MLHTNIQINAVLHREGKTRFGVPVVRKAFQLPNVDDGSVGPGNNFCWLDWAEPENSGLGLKKWTCPRSVQLCLQLKNTLKQVYRPSHKRAKTYAVCQSTAN